MLTRVEKAAAPATRSMIESMNKKRPEEWVIEFLEFRRQFGRTDAAAKLVKKYDRRRATQREVGKTLFADANVQFRSKNKKRGRKLLREILAKAAANLRGPLRSAMAAGGLTLLVLSGTGVLKLYTPVAIRAARPKAAPPGHLLMTSVPAW